MQNQESLQRIQTHPIYPNRAILDKRILSAFLILICSASPARAEEPCKVLDNLLGTVSLIRDIESRSEGALNAQYISELDSRISKLSLTVLIPIQATDALPTESKTLSKYISSLHEVVAAAQDGNSANVNGPYITPEFTHSLRSLDAYWNCSPKSNLQASNIAPPTGQPQLFGTETGHVIISGRVFERGGKDTSNVQGSESNGKTLSPLAAKPVEIRRVNIIVTMIVMTLLSISAAIFFRNRHKKFEIREARRLLRLPVRVRLGNANHAMLLMDLSMNGAKIKHSDIIDRQSKLQIYLKGDWHVAHIKWSNKLFAGVMFKTPLDAGTFSSILQS